MNRIISTPFIINARFVDSKTVMPYTGPTYEFRLYYRDLVEDEAVASCKLNARGEANISFSLEDTFDPLLDSYPDLYFILYHNYQPMYQSDVIDLSSADPIQNDSCRINLGTHVV
ncbi:MAG: hypothetical protein AAFN93_05125 [Bacteroidota bacterium]